MDKEITNEEELMLDGEIRLLEEQTVIVKKFATLNHNFFLITKCTEEEFKILIIADNTHRSIRVYDISCLTPVYNIIEEKKYENQKKFHKSIKKFVTRYIKKAYTNNRHEYFRNYVWSHQDTIDKNNINKLLEEVESCRG